MLYRFGAYQLDTDKIELRSGDERVALEPQVFALLTLLVENRERLVSRDEIVEKIWDGRYISEAAVSSCVKSARRAVGDDGTAQRLIRTVHGRGFRFVAEVAPAAAPVAARADSDPAPLPDSQTGKPSIAVLPFRLLGQTETHGAIAEAIPHELIFALSRLRWLFVIARGSSFRFRPSETDVATVGELLRARYCVTGAVEIFGKSITIAVELTDTRDGGIVWAERFSSSIDEVHEIRARIVANIVSALEVYIPLNEARIAETAVPENLDTWAAYHLGLQRMHRFNKHDNLAAIRLFESAIAKEPGFARAHAGLSFTRFQNAFQRLTDDTAAEIAAARAAAERAIELDPLDPFANFTMGRSYWLTGDLEGSLSWLERSISLSPNYAQGFYAKAWTDTFLGRGGEGRAQVDTAISLSPLDPFLYAMQSIRGLTYAIDGDFVNGALWAERGARAPGAHYLIAMIAAAVRGMAGDGDKAKAWAAKTLGRRPEANVEAFFRAFPVADDSLRRDLGDALIRCGFPQN